MRILLRRQSKRIFYKRELALIPCISETGLKEKKKEIRRLHEKFIILSKEHTTHFSIILRTT